MLSKHSHPLSLFLLSCLILFLLPACSEKLEYVEVKDEFGNIEKYSRQKDDYAKEGPYTKVGPNGIKIEEAHYKNDTLHGTRTIFHRNGQAEIVENIVFGQFEGSYGQYYENGNVELEGQYTNGSMNGAWKRYYKSGALMEVVRFENNEENGPFIEYYENGKLKAEGNYRNGDYEHGLLKLYSEDGELAKKMNCENGVCHTIWQLSERE